MSREDLVFTVLLQNEGGRFTALCPELDIASGGRTRAQARKNLNEAVSLYLETCFRENLPYLRPVPRQFLADLKDSEPFRLKVCLTVATSA